MTPTRLPQCEPERLIELQAGMLPEAEAAGVRAHAETCAVCQAELRKADDIVAALVTMQGDTIVSDEQRERSWDSLAAAAQTAAQQQQRRRAVTVLWQGPGRWLAAAAVVALATAAIFAWRALNTPEIAEGPEHAPTPTLAPAPLPHPPAPAPAPDEQLALSPENDAIPTPTPVALPSTTPAGTPAPTRQPARVTTLACGATIAGDGTYRLTRNDEAGARIALSQGRIHLEVPKLGETGSLEVATTDAQIVVHGTRFTVTKTADTHVSVTEGVVSVEPVGRPQENRFLRAGDDARVASVDVFLHATVASLDEAIDVGDYPAAEAFAQQYLTAADDGHASSDVRMQLAGVLRQGDRADEAMALYREVADGDGAALVRENALAMLATLQSEVGEPTEADAIWSELVQRFPDGVHTDDALMRLVEATCGDATPQAREYRNKLAERLAAGGSMPANALLARCGYVVDP